MQIFLDLLDHNPREDVGFILLENGINEPKYCYLKDTSQIAAMQFIF